MITKDVIKELQDLVDLFLKQERPYYLSSDSDYAAELESKYEDCTHRVLKDLKRDHNKLLKEDCEEAKRELQEELDSIKSQLQDIAEKFDYCKSLGPDSPNKGSLLEIQINFCNKIIPFIQSLIKKIGRWEDDALTIAESINCYFTSVRYNKEEIPIICDNLIKLRWISEGKTTRDDFFHYFTGEGTPSYKPIRWLKEVTWLTLFIDFMTYDDRIWVKTSRMFERQDNNSNRACQITPKTLSNSFKRFNNTNERVYEAQDEIQRKVLCFKPS